MLRRTQAKFSLSTWLTGLLMFIVLAVSSVIHAAELDVTVRLDRNPVIANEAFNLIITANEELPNWAFDSKALLRDFIVGPTSVESSRSVQQGVSSHTTRWLVRLTARHPGHYVIPAFVIEGFTTQAIEFEVIEAISHLDGEQRPFFLQAEVTNPTPYIQQQFIYKVELFLQVNAPLDSGTIQEPQVNHADVELITQNRERQEIINGQRYRVITQEYAITPQRSGKLHIQGAVFNGIYRSRSLSSFTRPEQVTLHSADLTLDVQPKPSNFPGTWLISEQVTLEEEWDSDRLVLPLGEPITRTITVTAAGVRAEQLPELQLTWPQELRVYPERPQASNSVHNGLRLAQTRQSIVLIPAQTGTVTLPAVSLPWFNSRTQQIEYAHLPERVISLTSPPGGRFSPQAQASYESFAQLEEQTTPFNQQTDNQTALETPTSVKEDQRQLTNRLYLTALILLAVLWLATLVFLVCLLFKFKRLRQKEPVSSGQIVPPHARAALNALKKACQQNNNQATLLALIQWQQSRHKGIGQISDLYREFAQQPEFIEQLQQLEQSLYGKEKVQWQAGQALWQAIANLHAQQQQTATTPSLYPH